MLRVISFFLIVSILNAVSSSVARADVFENKIYGFILPKYIFASAGLITFANNYLNHQNEVAPSAAAVGDYGTNSRPRSTWQIGQSRFGTILSYGPELNGQIEFDLVNNITAATPEFVLLAPRLRIAKIDYRLSTNLLLTFGLDWDIFNGGVGSYTYNTVGNYYQAGNVGFLRQQFIIKYGEAQGLSLSVALGVPQKNDQTSPNPGFDGPQELTMIPSIAANLTYKEDSNNFYGISAITGRILYNTSITSAHVAAGTSIFAIKDLKVFVLRAKAYYGKDIHNLKILTLATGGILSGVSYDVYEYGGFFTLNRSLNEVVGIFGGLGYASVFDTNSIPSGTGSAATVMTGNFKKSLGIDFKLRQNLYAYVEFSSFRTRYNEGSPSNIHSYVANMYDFGMKLNI